MSTDLIQRAQAGDAEAFAALVEPYRRELQVHCYRMLGSVQDAEDVLQETLLSAWQGLAGFESRSSVRTWLYRVATNRTLDALRAGGAPLRSNTSDRIESGTGGISLAAPRLAWQPGVPGVTPGNLWTDCV